MPEQKELQESEYIFPYHYIPSLKASLPSTFRTLTWGWEYLTYTSFILNKILNIKPKTLLDIGCGDGYLINELSKYSSSIQMKGSDTSERAIMFANAFKTSSKAIFTNENLFDINERFDIITLVEVIEHIPDEVLDRFLKKSFELSNEYVIISVPTTAFPLQSKHYRHYDEKLLSEQTKFTKDSFELVEQVRLYSNSRILNFIKRLFNNKYFFISNRHLNQFLWKTHIKLTFFSNENKGMHLVSIFKKIKA